MHKGVGVEAAMAQAHSASEGANRVLLEDNGRQSISRGHGSPKGGGTTEEKHPLPFNMMALRNPKSFSLIPC